MAELEVIKSKESYATGKHVLAGLKVINPYSLMKKISQGMVNEERLKGDASFVIMTKKEII